MTSFTNGICDFCSIELPGLAVSRTPHGLRGSGFEARSRRNRRDCLNLEPEIEKPIHPYNQYVINLGSMYFQMNLL